MGGLRREFIDVKKKRYVELSSSRAEFLTIISSTDDRFILLEYKMIIKSQDGIILLVGSEAQWHDIDFASLSRYAVSSKVIDCHIFVVLNDVIIL